MRQQIRSALRGILIALWVVFVFGAGPALAQTNTGPSAALGTTPSADFWRQIRAGKTGYVAGSPDGPNWLIKRVDKDKECLKAGTCTERIVGMVVPIHQKMPGVRESIGAPPTRNELYFTYGLFGLLFLAGLIFFALGLRPRRPDHEH